MKIVSMFVSMGFLAACAGGPSSNPDDSVSKHNTDGNGAKTGAPPQAATVRFIGRFDVSDPSHVLFAWPNSTIDTRFTGTQISVGLQDVENSGSGGNFFNVYLDDQQLDSLEVQPGVTQYVLAKNLPAVEHQVRLVKRTEASVGTSSFSGFSTDGQLLPLDQKPRRILEVIGDSISAGYGVRADVTAENMCSFTSSTEDSEQSFGMLAAKELGADGVAIAYSGKGVYTNLSQSDGNTLPALYGRILPAQQNSSWGFNSPAPQAVVIALGSNDFHASTFDVASFQQAYQEFIGQVRAKYPNTSIFVTLGVGVHDAQPNTVLESVVANINSGGDLNVFAVDLSVSASGTFGCDYHPSASTQQAMARLLVDALRKHGEW